ncbi:dual specificity protein phosphatase 16 [Denticeps clupeoides]|uniref:Dual specificity protein phosphatase 16 n=1 Tax=Denticeps clupeoides TaxID=299321 RepID=A0AAY4EBF1_9TELE|nr:dual specificity protein phosphatase 16 [Denticeps clupeoides]XP_028810781.1 dual specificity protein phosphatase 16 [Denticeps clupeoides]XP_028810782.1 dual specificity protein phosphatase 16 [Denticeps clupeoides]XP_028810783.1 dual specificity protein phosphatase 16 [Denticeps clupeoides]XP_028810784.1 dual specificity protein phosphatase 16 [Denticeps clupeoides]
MSELPANAAAPGSGRSVQPIGAEGLVALLEGGLDRVLLIDSRPFVDYNASHILEAVNVNCSKLMKRRLQQDKVQIAELLQHSAKKKLELQSGQEVVVYDQNSSDPTSLSSEAFLSVLLAKLEKSFLSVHLLSGGFVEFSHLFPGLCEGKSALVPSCISQPCLPVTNVGPTRILPHLYLGCQRDVLNKDLMQQNDIAYVLNASNTCPKPDFIPESHFLRVPVNDSFCEKILPWLDKSVEFIEKAKACNSRVLVHCLAGISRSATIAIAYIMKRMDMSLDEAYRFVKEKRPTISPNFNFLGQLLDFEKKLKSPADVVVKPRSLSPCHVEEVSSAQDREGGDTGISGANKDSASTAPLEPLTLPCILAGVPEEQLLAQALCSLQLGEGLEDSARLKRTFSLDIKSYGDTNSGSSAVRGFTSHPASGDAPEYFKPAGFKEAASKPCQFSPVEEVSEQSTPEQSPDKEQVDAPTTRTACAQPLQRSGSMEDGPSAASVLFGLSRSQQQLSTPGPGAALKGWHSDILLGPMAVASASLAGGGWYLSSESARFYSTSAIFSSSGGGGFAYSCSQGLEAVRRRGRQKSGDRGDSRRSWHEESNFEKQLKRRSCQMEFGDGMSETRSREELGKVGSQSSFSGSMEIIEVS